MLSFNHIKNIAPSDVTETVSPSGDGCWYVVPNRSQTNVQAQNKYDAIEVIRCGTVAFAR